MADKRTSATFREGSLDTLAQNGTNFYHDSTYKPAIIVTGLGSELGNDKVLKGKAKRKTISQTMSLSLIEIAKRKGQTEKVKSLWNTYHCQNKLYSIDGRLYGKYCKNRYCTLCCCNRKADIINRYIPVISHWEKPYFVTLTIKACKAPSLKKMLKGVIRGFRLITEKYRKRSQRSKGIKLIGIKSLECNFNPKQNTYNPHLHLIVANKEIAETLIKEWLIKWTPKFATRAAQHYRPIQDLQRDLIETIKYGSKIFTEPDVNKKAKSNTDNTIYTAALSNIFDGMKGLRIFDRFGFDLPKDAAKITTNAQVVNEYYEWEFSPEHFDWCNVDNELVLSAFAPTAGLSHILTNCIDTNAE